MPLNIDKHLEKKEITDTPKGLNIDKYLTKDFPTTPIDPLKSIIGKEELAGTPEKPFGQYWYERWGESENILKKSLGQGIQEYGVFGYLMPFQWAMSSLIGGEEEVIRMVSYNKFEKIRDYYAETGDLPDDIDVGMGMSYGELKAQNPERVEEVKDRIIRTAEAPFHLEKPMGFIKSMGEAISRTAWAGDVERYIKDPTPTERAIATAAGFVIEWFFDPITRLHIDKPPPALKKNATYKLASRLFADNFVAKHLLTNDEIADSVNFTKRLIKTELTENNAQIVLKALASQGKEAMKSLPKYTTRDIDYLANMGILQYFMPKAYEFSTQLANTEPLRTTLWYGNKLIATDEKLSKIAKKLDLAYISEKAKELPIFKLFQPELKEVPSLYYAKKLSQGMATDMGQKLISASKLTPKLAGMSEKEKIYTTLILADKGGTTALSRYIAKQGEKTFQLKVLPQDEIGRFLNKYPNVIKEAVEDWQKVAKIDKAFGIPYNEVAYYVPSIIHNSMKSKALKPKSVKKLLEFTNTSKEWYQYPKMYENVIEAWEAGLDPILNFETIKQIRVQATANAIGRRSLLNSIADVLGTSKPKIGYTEFTSSIFGKKWFPKKITDMLQSEQDVVNFGRGANEIVKAMNQIQAKWKMMVTVLSPIPAFEAVNLQTGLTMNVLTFGKKSLSLIPDTFNIMLNKNMKKVITSDQGVTMTLEELDEIMNMMHTKSGFITKISREAKEWPKGTRTYVEKMKTVGEKVEEFLRSNCWLSGWQKTSDPMYAWLMTLVNQFDYTALTGFERWGIGFFAPFWTFVKNIHLRGLELVATRPGAVEKAQDIIRAIQGLAPERETEKEPRYFSETPHIKTPIKYKDRFLYVNLPMMPYAIPLETIAGLTRMLEPELTGKERLFEAMRPAVLNMFPHWQEFIEQLVNYDFFLRREKIPDWAKDDPSYRVKAPYQELITLLPHKYKELMGIETKFIEGKETVMMKPIYRDVLSMMPYHYAINYVFDAQRYADYTERQQNLDRLSLLIGVKFRDVDYTFYDELNEDLKKEKAKREIEIYLYNLEEQKKTRKLYGE